ncbi:MAG: Cleavage polyadenylation factor subunit clp1 [Candelina submexicana]|nr:MAG: Cleavage polyadenylation factor subunit clp1 [Candelina submexicana]
MALPGLQLSAPTPVPVAAPSTHDISKGSEWRFEVAYGDNIDVKLLSGTAELFGTELAPNQVYTFTGTKAAIYTWHGCQIEVTGDCQVEYTAEETPMVSYANTHFALEDIRQKAALNGKDGPRIMVVGPENAGKTSLVKLLTAYATRVGRQPVVVNLDSREGLLSIPGSLTTTAFASIIDVEEGWGSSPTSGPTPVPVKLPLTYYFGQPSPEDDSKMFKPIVSRLAVAVMGRLADDVEAKGAGCIIDTPGVVSQGKGGYEIIQHVVSEFSVNVLLVLGSERLYSDMIKRFDGKQNSADEVISVVKLAKSGGCVDRDESFMKQARQAQIKEYFYGDARTSLSPHIQLVKFDQITVFKLADSSDLMASLLPGGEAEDFSAPAIFEKVEPSPLMQSSLLAIMHASPNDTQENIRDSTVMGFVWVKSVDEAKQEIQILAPVSGRVPKAALIWGPWPEGVGDLVG